jgi:hypothetical protein
MLKLFKEIRIFTTRLMTKTIHLLFTSRVQICMWLVNSDVKGASDAKKTFNASGSFHI